MGAGRRLVDELRAVHRLAGARFLARYLGQLLLHAPDVLRTGTLAPADDALGRGEYTVTVDGRPITLAGASFGLAREIYGRRSYFAPPGFFFRPTDAVVDLGAHVGTFTVLACRFAARVVAVEPDASRVAELHRNVERNGCADRVAVELASVPALTMDELVERYGLDPIDFLKIDVEGAEFELFRGEPGWLRRVDRIAMEVHPDAGRPEELAAMLAAAGFDIRLTDADLRPVSRVEPPGGYLFARRA